VIAPGTRLGPYEIVGQIGVGGMGIVYRARDPRLERDLAIKVLAAEQADALARERFVREARAASSLNHPHIVTIYDVGEAEAIGSYYAMELVLGRTLREIAHGGPIPAEIKKAIMEVMSKGYYLNNFVNRILLKKSHARVKVVPSLNNEITLSDRERDVIKYICMEFTAHEIAQKLEVSPRTVEAIKDRLMERFGAKNTAGLVFFAVKNNLID